MSFKNFRDFIVKYPLLILSAALVLIFFVVDMIISNRDFSEMENRYLNKRPTFSWSSLMENKFSRRYEDYINDQFVLRDQWISLKSRSEYLLGKIENNGIVFGSDHYLFEKYQTFDQEKLTNNTAFVQAFLDKYDLPVTFGIIPSSYEILSDKLPEGLANVDQSQYIQQAVSSLKDERLQTLDLIPSLEAEKEQYIYYRTDHHWTTYGAWLAYRDYALSRGLTPVEYEGLTGHTVEGFYGSYYSKAKLFNAEADTIHWMDIPVDSVTVTGKNGDTVYDSLYNDSQWEVRDKYAAFLYGNNGVTVIRSDNNLNRQEGRTSRVLLIKDSFGNSFAPYLTYNYDEVYVIDLRSTVDPLSELLDSTEFDDVLILYNFMNYTSDTNFAKLTY